MAEHEEHPALPREDSPLLVVALLEKEEEEVVEKRAGRGYGALRGSPKAAVVTEGWSAPPRFTSGQSALSAPSPMTVSFSPTPTDEGGFESRTVTGRLGARLSVLSDGTLRRVRSSALVAKRFVNIYGPGIVVMLADVDAGSILTAADSGRAFGYSMIWVNLLFTVPLYMAQELTVRVGGVTGCGFVELLRRRLGVWPARLTAVLMAVSSGGAMASELSG
eukprot:Hpha_TRINITY_DN29985_c0_g1::TRINITY_DN29985_c0_g1_i1::g.131882::m.131882